MKFRLLLFFIALSVPLSGAERPRRHSAGEIAPIISIDFAAEKARVNNTRAIDNARVSVAVTAATATPLQRAFVKSVATHDFEAFQSLLTSNPELAVTGFSGTFEGETFEEDIQFTSKDGAFCTIAHVCVVCGLTKFVECLRAKLGKRAFVNLRDSNGLTLLHYAVWGHHLHLVKYFIKECNVHRHIATPDIRTNTGTQAGIRPIVAALASLDTPANASTYALLRYLAYDLDSERICPVCHEAYADTADTLVTIITCGHHMHQPCFEDLCSHPLDTKRKFVVFCPLCRHSAPLLSEKLSFSLSIYPSVEEARILGDVSQKMLCKPNFRRELQGTTSPEEHSGAGAVASPEERAAREARTSGGGGNA